MNAHELYGVEPGQIYARADGGPGRVLVQDVETHAASGDVVVFDEAQKTCFRIGAFHLAKVQYYLVDFKEGDTQLELFHALRAGTANALQQKQFLQLFQAMRNMVDEQKAYARRGHFLVDNGEWRTREDPRDGHRTWLCLRVPDHANLSCKGTRASAIDAVIRQEESS